MAILLFEDRRAAVICKWPLSLHQWQALQVSVSLIIPHEETRARLCIPQIRTDFQKVRRRCCIHYKGAKVRLFLLEINPRFGGSLAPYFFSFVREEQTRTHVSHGMPRRSRFAKKSVKGLVARLVKGHAPFFPISSSGLRPHQQASNIVLAAGLLSRIHQPPGKLIERAGI